MANYEELNRKSKACNLSILKTIQLPSQELSKELVNEVIPSLSNHGKITKPKKRISAAKVKRSTSEKIHEPPYPKRYATRSSTKNPEQVELLHQKSFVTPEKSPKRKQPPKDNIFGAVPGVKVGEVFLTRMECSRAGVHRPTVAGIHGNKNGCYSVALSGNYEDDEDNFFTFTYTGCGGRDLKGSKANPKNLRTAPQSKDQDLNPRNLSLTVSAEKKLPVRVIRGYKLGSQYAPEEGYRYDGLYYVRKYYQDVGKSGFKVYKFFLERCPNQDLPWIEEDSSGNNDKALHAENALPDVSSNENITET